MEIIVWKKNHLFSHVYTLIPKGITRQSKKKKYCQNKHNLNTIISTRTIVYNNALVTSLRFASGNVRKKYKIENVSLFCVRFHEVGYAYIYLVSGAGRWSFTRSRVFRFDPFYFLLKIEKTWKNDREEKKVLRPNFWPKYCCSTEHPSR